MSARLEKIRRRFERRALRFLSAGRQADELAFLRCVAAVSCSDVWTVRHHRRRALQIPKASRALGVEAIPPAWFDKARLAIRLGWVGRPETWPR